MLEQNRAELAIEQCYAIFQRYEDRCAAELKKEQASWSCSYCGGKLTVDTHKYLVCEDCGGV